MPTARLEPYWVPDVARYQDGLFTAQQALAAGATPAQVRRARQGGRWLTIAGSALALPTTPRSAWTLARAASLTWPDGVVCLRAAATVHGLPVSTSGEVDVIVPGRRRTRLHLVPHRLRLGEGDVIARSAVRLTSLQRTLFDCIGHLAPDEVQGLVAWAATRDLLDADALAAAVGDRPGWHGNPRRREALTDVRRGTLSAAERLLRRVMRDGGLVGWELNASVIVEGEVIARADALFARERLVVEIDGARFHRDDTWQRDLTRQNRLVAAGYTVLRFTWADLTKRPTHVVDRIRQTLALLASARRRSITT